ncbi:inositol monophosphatase [Allostella vacuolata]|nr:inositol monophosphatase [Stella vacuolata]
MIPPGLGPAVESLMREAAARAILPRFRALAAGDILEKQPGELVTVADREAEAILARGLALLLPGSTVVGEEAVALDDGLRRAVAATDRLWLVDPLDGTANFVAGDTRFAVMVALLRHGQTVAAWMLQPEGDIMAAAERGAGATLDGVRIAVPADSPESATPTGAILTRFLPPEVRERIALGVGRLGPVLPGMRCAGTEYPAIAAGRQDYALFWRTEPWDHAPGALFLAEAGGRAARPDGSPYRPGDGRKGLLVARSPAVWDQVADALFD